MDEKKMEKDGYVFEEFGECYLMIGDKSMASENFKKAYEILSQDQWLLRNEKDRIERLKLLSGIR